MSLRGYNRGNSKRNKFSNVSLPSVRSIDSSKYGKTKKKPEVTNLSSEEISWVRSKDRSESLDSERITEESEEDDEVVLSDDQNKMMPVSKTPKDFVLPFLRILQLPTHRKQKDLHNRNRKKSKRREFGGFSIISEGGENVRTLNNDDTILNPNFPSVKLAKVEDSFAHVYRQLPPTFLTPWKEINYEDFVILELLGHGALSKVYKAWHKPTKQFVALKYLELACGRESEIMADAKNEVKILERLNSRGHQNIVKFFDIFIEDRTSSDQGNNKLFLIIMMEYGRSSMADILKVRKKYSEREILFIMRDVCDALIVAEKMGIANRDIKPQNLILSYDMKSYKVADFGVGCMVTDKRDLVKLDWAVGTSIFLSPEVYSIYLLNLKGRAKTIIYNPFKSDVYSLGITVMRMMGLRQTLFQKRRKDFDIDKTTLDNVKQEYPIVVALLRQMLKKNYIRRIGFEELLAKLKEQSVFELDENECVSKLPDKFESDEVFKKHKHYIQLADLYGNIEEQLLNSSEPLELPSAISRSFNQTIQNKHPDFHKAFECLQIQLRFLKKGADSLETESPTFKKPLIEVFYRIGLCYFKMKDYLNAKEYVLKSLRIWGEMDPANKEKSFLFNHSLSQIYFLLGDVKESWTRAQQTSLHLNLEAGSSQNKNISSEGLRLQIISNDFAAKAQFLASLEKMKLSGKEIDHSKRINITKLLSYQAEPYYRCSKSSNQPVLTVNSRTERSPGKLKNNKSAPQSYSLFLIAYIMTRLKTRKDMKSINFSYYFKLCLLKKGIYWVFSKCIRFLFFFISR